MPRHITNMVKHERAKIARENPMKKLKSSIRTGTYKDNRKNASMYASSHWKKLRQSVLDFNPFCVNCGDAATTVDHIAPHGGNWKLFLDVENCQSLCKACHDKKTQVERRLPRVGPRRLSPFPKPKPPTDPVI